MGASAVAVNRLSERLAGFQPPSNHPAVGGANVSRSGAGSVGLRWVGPCRLVQKCESFLEAAVFEVVVEVGRRVGKFFCFRLDGEVTGLERGEMAFGVTASPSGVAHQRVSALDELAQRLEVRIHGRERGPLA